MNAYIGLVLLVAAFLALAWWTRRQRTALGLARGTIISADDSQLGSPTIRSARLGLVGRCDHLLRVGGAYVPVEQKPRARRLMRSHVLQVGALCMLVEEAYGARPPYGVVVLGDGTRERVPFSRELEQAVRSTMNEMRLVLAAGTPPGPRWVAPKCRACGHRQTCWNDPGTVLARSR